MERLQQKLCQLGVHTQTEYPLSHHSSFRIGGAAALAAFPNSRTQMLDTLQAVQKSGVRSLVIGRASNVVFSDTGFEGVVIFTTAWQECTQEGKTLHASAGCTLYALACAAERASLAGLEFAHGIPGTLGGAVMMNAGAYGGSIADVCCVSEYFDPTAQEIRRAEGDVQCFGYRTSMYTDHPDYAILSATLTLSPDDRGAIRARMDDYKARRRATQPLEYPSAGSVFKRPEGHFAGKLIEDCGLKGLCIGGAEVSRKHAGFIVNRGDATAEDVRRLVDQIQTTVYRETGVLLECEIRFL